MRHQLGPFIARFDALFTLNQDLHMERGYGPRIPPMGYPRWSGFGSPGISGPPPPAGYDPDHQVRAPRAPLTPDQFRVSENIQPYFKLHGSSNWRSGDGENLLIMGGNKPAAIGTSELLRWYWERFNHYLCAGDTKLMVAGYSFSDPHINEAILNAASHGLRLFIVDVKGTDVLDHRDPRAHITQPPTELMERLQPLIIGVSTRLLRNSFGDDVVEHGNVASFFDNRSGLAPLY